MRQEVYYTEHGEYAETEALDQLTAKHDNSKSDTKLVVGTKPYEFVRASHADSHNRYTLYLDHSVQFPGNVYCEALATDEVAKGVCIAEGGTQVDTDNGYLVYYLSGGGTGAFSPIASSTSCGPNCVQYTFKEGIPIEYAKVRSDGHTNVKDSSTHAIYEYDTDGDLWMVLDLAGLPCARKWNNWGDAWCMLSNYPTTGSLCETFPIFVIKGESILE